MCWRNKSWMRPRWRHFKTAGTLAPTSVANASGEGNLVVLFGARTGLDGIGGVSVLASDTFSGDESGSGRKKLPSVQVGDPFMEKLLIEATLEVLVDDIRRDKTGQVMTRVRELAERANSHWASLLSALIIAGESTACYDGQYFFDTDHAEGDSGTQDNDIGVDISALPAAVHGVVTAPSVEEMQQSILKGIAQKIGRASCRERVSSPV